MATRHAALLAGLAAALAAGCASGGDYVWVEAFQASRPRPAPEYVIGPGDLLDVRVFGQEPLSGQVRVRQDGMISLPLVNDQQASGVTPAMLAELLEAQLRTFVKEPRVTVVLAERHPAQVSVLGEVAKPGVYPLEPGQGVLRAIAQAAGITPFASADRIFVVRRPDDGAPRRIRFRYRALTGAEPRAAAFGLQDGDVVVVE